MNQFLSLQRYNEKVLSSAGSFVEFNIPSLTPFAASHTLISFFHISKLRTCPVFVDESSEVSRPLIRGFSDDRSRDDSTYESCAIRGSLSFVSVVCIGRSENLHNNVGHSTRSRCACAYRA